MNVTRFSVRSVDQELVEEFRELQLSTRLPAALLLEESIELLLGQYCWEEEE